jgi:hypothetical protein
MSVKAGQSHHELVAEVSRLRAMLEAAETSSRGRPVQGVEM